MLSGSHVLGITWYKPSNFKNWTFDFHISWCFAYLWKVWSQWIRTGMAIFIWTINNFFYCRKDFFYPYDQYREVNLPDPIHGGRFHLVSISSTSGTPGQVTLNGKAVKFESGQNSDDWYVDWMLVYPTTLVKGEPVWVSFHTRWGVHMLMIMVVILYVHQCLSTSSYIPRLANHGKYSHVPYSWLWSHYMCPWVSLNYHMYTTCYIPHLANLGKY